MGLFKKIAAAAMVSAALAAPAVAEISPDITETNYRQGEAKVSPDGKYLALALINGKKRILTVVDTKTFKQVGGMNFGKTQDVGNFFWATDERLVMEILHRTEWDDNPKYYGELFSIDYDGKHPEKIFGFRAGEKQVGSVRKKKKNVYGWGKVISMLPEDDKHILISSTLSPGGSRIFTDEQKRDEVNVVDIKNLHSSVHRLNINTGKMSASHTRSPAPNTSFFTTEKGELNYAIGGSSDKTKELYQYVDEKWKRIALNDGSSSDVLPVGFNKSFSKVFYLDFMEGEQTCLFSYNLTSGEKAKVNENCNLGSDPVSVTADNAIVYALKTSEAAVPYQVFDTSVPEAEFFSQIVDVFKGFDIDITSGSEDGSYWVVRATDANDATSFYLYSGESNQFSKLM